MMYDSYVNKIKKLAKIKNIIYKLRFVILAITVAIIVLVTTLLINKGKINEFEISNELTYGENINVSSDSFMSDISYQYRKIGEDNWIDGLPKESGSYEIRVVTNGAFGNKYSDIKILTINKKDLNLNLENNNVLYGSYPKLKATGLLNEDRIENEIYTYSDLSINNTLVNLNLAALKIVDKNGLDVTNNYNIVSESSFNINFLKLDTKINATLVKEYDDMPFDFNNIYSITNLGYDDKLIWNGSYEVYDFYDNLISNPKDVGNYKLVSTGFDIINQDISTINNYNISNLINDNIITNLEIRKKEITVSTGDFEIEYDGLDHHEENFTINGLVNNHYAIINPNLEEKYVHKDVVDKLVNRVDIIILDSNDIDVTSNYNIKEVCGSFTIYQKNLNISTSNLDVDYDGNYHESTDYLANGLIENHNIEILNPTKEINAGTYTNKFSVLVFDESNIDVSANYNINYEYGLITINKKELDVKLYSYATYGDLEFEDYVIVDNLDNSYTYEEISFNINNGNINLNELNAKTYYDNDIDYIFKFNVLATNYILNINKYEIVIYERELDIKLNNVNHIYDSFEYNYNPNDYQINNLINNDELELSFKYINESGDLNHNNVGLYVVIPYINNSNYYLNSEYVNIDNYYNFNFIGILNVLKKDINILTSSLDITYDGLSHNNLDYTESGLIDNQRIEVIYNPSIKNVGTISNDLEINIFDDLDIDVTSNYNIIYEYGTLTINKKDLVLIINEVADFKYNGKTFNDFSYYVEASNGFVLDEYIEYELLIYKNNNISNVKEVGKYEIRFNEDESYLNSNGRENYNLVYESVEFNILKANIYVKFMPEFIDYKTFDDVVYDFNLNNLEIYNDDIKIDNIYDTFNDLYYLDVTYKKYNETKDIYENINNILYKGNYLITPILEIENYNNYEVEIETKEFNVYENSNVTIKIGYNYSFDVTSKVYDDINELSNFRPYVLVNDHEYDIKNLDYSFNITYIPNDLNINVTSTEIKNAGSYLIKFNKLKDKNNSINLSGYQDIEYEFEIIKRDLDIYLLEIEYNNQINYDGNYHSYNNLDFNNFISYDDVYDHSDGIKLKVLFKDSTLNIFEEVKDVGQYNYYVDLENTFISPIVNNNYNINIIGDYKFIINKMKLIISPFSYDRKVFDNVNLLSYDVKFKNEYEILDGNIIDGEKINIDFDFYDSNNNIVNPIDAGIYYIKDTNIYSGNDNTILDNYDIEIIGTSFEINKADITLVTLDYYETKTYDGAYLDNYLDSYDNFILQKNTIFDVTGMIKGFIKFKDLDGYPKDAGYYEYKIDSFEINNLYVELFNKNINVHISDILRNVTINKKLINITYNLDMESSKTFDNKAFILNTDYLIVEGLIDNNDINNLNEEFYFINPLSTIVTDEIIDAGKYIAYLTIDANNYYILDDAYLTEINILKREVSIKPKTKTPEGFNNQIHEYNDYDYIYLDGSSKASDFNDEDFKVTFKYYSVDLNQFTNMIDAGVYYVYIDSILDNNYSLINDDYTEFSILKVSYTLHVKDKTLEYGSDLSKEYISFDYVEKENESDIDLDTNYSFEFEIKDLDTIYHVGIHYLELDLIIYYDGEKVTDFSQYNSMFSVATLKLTITKATLNLVASTDSFTFNNEIYTKSVIKNNKIEGLKYNESISYNEEFYLDNVLVDAKSVGIYESRIDLNSILVYESNGTLKIYDDYIYDIEYGSLYISPITINVYSENMEYPNYLDLNIIYEFATNKEYESYSTDSKYEYFVFSITAGYPKFSDLEFSIKFSCGTNTNGNLNDVGVYILTPTLTVSNGFTSCFKIADVTFTIVEKSIKIDFESKTLTYDGNSHSLTDYLATGLLDGNRIELLDSMNHTNVGNYSVLQSDIMILDSNDLDVTANYKIKTSGNLVITKRTLYIYYKDIEIEYDSYDHTLNEFEINEIISYTSNLVENHRIEKSNSGYESIKYVGSIENQIDVIIKDINDLDVTANYDIIKVAATFSIKKRKVDVTFNDIVGTYGASSIANDPIFSKDIPDLYSINNYLDGTLLTDFDLEIGTYNLESYIEIDNLYARNSYDINYLDNDVILTIGKGILEIETYSESFYCDGKYHKYESFRHNLSDKYYVTVLGFVEVKDIGEYENTFDDYTVIKKGRDVTDNFTLSTNYGVITIFEYATIAIQPVDFTGSVIDITPDMVTNDSGYEVTSISYECSDEIKYPGHYQIRILSLTFSGISNVKNNAIDLGELIDFEVKTKMISVTVSPLEQVFEMENVDEFELDPYNYQISSSVEADFSGLMVIEASRVSYPKVLVVYGMVDTSNLSAEVRNNYSFNTKKLIYAVKKI